MDEFGARREARPLHALAEKVFDRLDVVVRRLLDFLDATGVLDGESVRYRGESLLLGGGKRFAFGYLLLGRERGEPRALDGDAALHEPVFGKDFPELGAFAGVAPVDRPDGRQRIEFHQAISFATA